MNFNFEIEGIDDALDILEDIGPKKAKNLLRATAAGMASEIAKDIKKNTPVDTGELKKSIKTKRRRSQKDHYISDVVVERGSSAKYDGYYWRFVEYGTAGNAGNPPAPFIRPAAEKYFNQIDKKMTQQFGKKYEALLRREARKKGLL